MEVVRVFSSFSDLMRFLDREIQRYRRELGRVLRLLERLHARYEVFEGLRRLLTKSVGPEVSNTVRLPSITLRLEHPIKEQIDALEEAAESLNRIITGLEGVRRDLGRFPELMDVRGLEIEVIFIDGIPKIIHVKTK